MSAPTAGILAALPSALVLVSMILAPVPLEVTGAITFPNAWEDLTDFPAPRDQGGMVYDGSAYFYLVGGTDGVDYISTVWRYSIGPGSWTSIALDSTSPMPEPRRGAQFAWDSNRDEILMFGGRDANGVIQEDLWAFNVTNSAWVGIASSGGPGPRFKSQGFFDAGRDSLFVFSGIDSSFQKPNSLHQYNRSGAGWVSIPHQSPPTGRSNTSMTMIDADRAYLFGGRDSNNLDQTQLYELDLTTVQWTEVTVSTTPPAISDITLAYNAATGELLAYGGYTELFGGLESRATLIYNEGNTTWWIDISSTTPTPPTRSLYQMAYRNGEAWMFGGFNYTNSGLHTTFSDMWRYNFAINRWYVVNPAASNREPLSVTFAGSVYDGSSIWSMGGINDQNGFSEEISSLDMASKEWTQYSPDGFYPRRQNPAIEVLPNGHFLVHGGYGETGPMTGFQTTLGDTWDYDPSFNTWSVFPSSNLPRVFAATAYDSSNSQVVMHGGLSSGTTQTDSYSWGGASTQWGTLTMANAPDRNAHSMVFRTANNQLYIWGGRNDAGLSNLDMYTAQPGQAWASVAQQGNIPAPRHGMAMAYESGCDCAYLFGGRWSSGSIEGFLGDTYRFDFQSSIWSQLNTPYGPEPRAFGHGFIHQGNFWVMGGAGSFSDKFHDLWEFNTAQSRWIRHLTDEQEPKERELHGFVEEGGLFYVFGGYAEHASTSSSFDGYADRGFYSYNPGTSTWAALNPPTLPPGRWSHAMATDQDTLWLFGGLQGFLQGDYFNDIWSYSISGDTWTDHSPFSGPEPSARRDASMVVDPTTGDIVVYGGLDLNGTTLSDVWRFTPGNGTWWMVSSDEVVGVHQGAATYHESTHELFIYGGNWDNGTVSNQLWRYSIDTDRWSLLPSSIPQPDARWGAALSSDSKGNLWMTGGFTPGFFKSAELWQFDIDQELWVLHSPLNSPSGRAYHGQIFYNGAVYMHNGITGGFVDDLWKLDISQDDEVGIELVTTDLPVAGNFLFAHYPNKISVTATDTRGAANINIVSLKFNPGESNEFTYTWSASSPSIISAGGDQTGISASTGGRLREDNEALEIEFNIEPDWDFAISGLMDLEVEVATTGLPATTRTYPAFAEVVTDLGFAGSLDIYGAEQGLLAAPFYVKPSEDLSFTGQTASYVGFPNIYPPVGTVNVFIEDDDGDRLDPALPILPGVEFNISWLAEGQEDLTTYNITLTGPAFVGKPVVSQSVDIGTDNTEVYFNNAQPPITPAQGPSPWVTMEIDIYDNGSGVDSARVEYNLSKAGEPPTGWLDLNQQGIYGIYTGVVVEQLNEGLNMIRWRAKDAVGNGWTYSDTYLVPLVTVADSEAPEPVENVLADGVQGGIEVTWDYHLAPDLLAYQVFISPNNLPIPLDDIPFEIEVPGLQTAVTLTTSQGLGLVTGETYNIAVVAIDLSSNGNYDVYTVDTAIPDESTSDTDPPNPIIPEVTYESGVIDISWEASTADDFQEYLIFVENYSFSTWADLTPVETIPLQLRSSTEVTVTPGVRYYIAVSAMDTVGNYRTTGVVRDIDAIDARPDEGNESESQGLDAATMGLVASGAVLILLLVFVILFVLKRAGGGGGGPPSAAWLPAEMPQARPPGVSGPPPAGPPPGGPPGPSQWGGGDDPYGGGGPGGW